jgi:hypothetical protein
MVMLVTLFYFLVSCLIAIPGLELRPYTTNYKFSENKHNSKFLGEDSPLTRKAMLVEAYSSW